MFLFSKVPLSKLILAFALSLAASLTAPSASAAEDSRLVFYNFSEGSGSVVHDTSGYGSPLNLSIDAPANTRWLSGGGLEVQKPALIASASAATKVIDAVKKSNELTIEAWIDPANTTQTGPARIVTLSKAWRSRNLSLGQDSTAYVMQLRSTETNRDGKPELLSPDGLVSTGLTHVVYTRSADGIARMYINGMEQSTGTVGGSLRNWADNYRFALANELTGDQPWLGRYYQVAVYSRAFDVGDVATRFAAGPEDAANSAAATSTTQDTNQETTAPVVERDSSTLVFYNFSEGSGAVVHDTSGYGSPLDLNIDDTANTHWLSGGGLEVQKPVLIASASAASKVIDAVKVSNELTIEAWIDPANTTQSGPARIVTLSQDPYFRNFTLGQESAAYVTRLRSTATDSNGLPQLLSADGLVSAGLTHVVYTRSADGIARMYINGLEQSTMTVGGALGNWADSYRFALGNELTGDRPWLGRYYQVAVYSRAFDIGDVSASFAAGPKDAAYSGSSTAVGDSASGTETITDVIQVGTATLNWQAPATRTDGTALSLNDIAGYTLYYGQSTGSYSKSLTINDAYTTSVTVTDLPVGTWYFTVTARDHIGHESDDSNTVTRVVN